MPPGITFDQQKVLDTGFEILRKEGIARLSARNIARRLGCSTQPVYSAFGSMDKLRGEVIKKAKEFIIEYLLRDQKPGEELFSSGMQYFHFARNEKVLFRFLLAEGHIGLTLEAMFELSGPLIERMKDDPFLKGIKEDRLGRIGRDLWIYTHGLIASTFESTRPDIEDIVRKRMILMGETVVGWEKYRNNLDN